MSGTLYFSYGSNLLRERLLARCPALRRVGRATLPGQRLTFNKLNIDGSGKCAFEPSPGDSVLGVLWQVSDSDLACLDHAEGAGHGYERTAVSVLCERRGKREAMTYLATHRDPDVRPWEWYLALVIAGAEQQSLPNAYIDAIRAVAFDIDPDPHREARLLALDALGSSGYQHLGHALAERYLAPSGQDARTADTLENHTSAAVRAAHRRVAG